MDEMNNFQHYYGKIRLVVKSCRLMRNYRFVFNQCKFNTEFVMSKSEISECSLEWFRDRSEISGPNSRCGDLSGSREKTAGKIAISKLPYLCNFFIIKLPRILFLYINVPYTGQPEVKKLIRTCHLMDLTVAMVVAM